MSAISSLRDLFRFLHGSGAQLVIKKVAVATFAKTHFTLSSSPFTAGSPDSFKCNPNSAKLIQIAYNLLKFAQCDCVLSLSGLL